METLTAMHISPPMGQMPSGKYSSYLQGTVLMSKTFY